MKNGKNQNGTSKRVLVLALALVLLLGCGIGGTIAWLMDSTQSVENTFTVGDVEITLVETLNTDTNNDGTNDVWQAMLIPGEEYGKDPVVTVTDKTNVDCYLFVKFEENYNPTTYLEYTSTLTTANGWTQGDGTNIPANVWYRTVGANDTVKSWNLLNGDKVTVKNTLTKDDMPAANSEPTLIYTAYAVQKDNVTDAAAAWVLLNPTNP